MKIHLLWYHYVLIAMWVSIIDICFIMGMLDLRKRRNIRRANNNILSAEIRATLL